MRRFGKLAVGGLASLALLLSACEKVADEPAPEAEVAEVVETAQEASPNGSAIAKVDGQDFEFTLTTCTFDGDDLTMSGPGHVRAADEPAWFSLEMSQSDSEWSGGVTITPGTEKSGSATDTSYVMLMTDQDDYGFSSVHMDDGGQVTFEGTALTDGGSKEVKSQVALACGSFTVPDQFDDSEEEPEEAAPATFSDVEQCLQGVWNADNNYFLEQIQELGDEAKSVSGDVTVLFDDDATMLTVYDDWLIEATVDGMDMEIHRSGTDQAEYFVTGDKIDIRDVNIGSAMKLVTPAFTTVVEAVPFEHTQVQVVCSANSATITMNEGTMQLSR